MTKRATFQVHRAPERHAHRRDLIVWIEDNGTSRRHYLLANVPLNTAQNAKLGAMKIMAALGYEVGEKS